MAEKYSFGLEKQPSISSLFTEVISKSNWELTLFKITNSLIKLLRRGGDSRSNIERVKAMLIISILQQRNETFSTKFEELNILGKKVGDKRFIFTHYRDKRMIDLKKLVKRKEPSHCDKPLFFSMTLSQYPVGLVVPWSYQRIKQMTANEELEKIPDPFMNIIWTKKVDWEPESPLKMTQNLFERNFEKEFKIKKPAVRITLPSDMSKNWLSPRNTPATQKNRIASIEDLMNYTVKGSATTTHKMFCFRPEHLRALTPLNSIQSVHSIQIAIPPKKKKKKKRMIRGFTQRLEDLQINKNNNSDQTQGSPLDKEGEDPDKFSTLSTMKSREEKRLERHFGLIGSVTPIQKRQEHSIRFEEEEEKLEGSENKDTLLESTLNSYLQEEKRSEYSPNLSGVLGSKFTKECYHSRVTNQDDPLGSPHSDKFHKKHGESQKRRQKILKHNKNLMKKVLIQNKKRKKSPVYNITKIKEWRGHSNPRNLDTGFSNFKKQKRFKSFKFQRKRVKIKRTVTPRHKKETLSPKRVIPKNRNNFLRRKSPGSQMKKKPSQSFKFRSKSKNNHKGLKTDMSRGSPQSRDQLKRRKRSYDVRSRQQSLTSTTNNFNQFRIKNKPKKSQKQKIQKEVSLANQRQHLAKSKGKGGIKHQQAILRRKIKSINPRISKNEDSLNKKSPLSSKSGSSFFKIKSRRRRERSKTYLKISSRTQELKKAYLV